jgi:hypothetical protein
MFYLSRIMLALPLFHNKRRHFTHKKGEWHVK